MRPTALFCLCLLPAAAAAQPAPFDAAAIDAAAYEGGALPEGQSALTVKVQALLDRAGTSPGVIDGWTGGMSTTALKAFERRNGLPVDGALDADTWTAMGGAQAGPIMQDYTITKEDTADLVDAIPDDYAERARLDSLGYLRLTEKLAERFHMDEDFLIALNGGRFEAGRSIAVVDPGSNVEATAARVRVDKANRRLTALDAAGNVIADGTTLAVEPRADSGTIEEAFQRAVRGGACLDFTTVLGPGTDAAHADHLHLDVKARDGGYRICQ